MASSLPSKLVYVIDVPEVKDLSADFKYDFFVPDESVSEISGIPKNVLAHPAGEIDSGFIQHVNMRVPRYVFLNWKPTKINVSNDSLQEHQVRNNAIEPTHGTNNLITKNINKILSEDDFSSLDYVSINFSDCEIEDKVYTFASGTLEQLTLNLPHDHNSSNSKAASKLISLLPKNIKPHFLYASMTRSDKHQARRFFDKGGKRINNKYFEKMKSVAFHTQISGKLLHSVINQSIHQPNNQFAGDLHTLHKMSKRVNTLMAFRASTSINEDEYKTIVPYIDLTFAASSQLPERQTAKIIGYIIDKFEILENGIIKEFPPIIIENHKSASAIDFHTKYGSTYAYSIRSIALFKVPAIDYESHETALLSMLISSKPSTKIYTTCVDETAPPPANDINFTWDYEKNKMLVHWSFPTNSQRDIKKFQVFRRPTIKHSFELIKQYDFDDSVIKAKPTESPAKTLVKFVTSPLCNYVDDDFNKQSTYIYTVCCIDAHGFTSNYGAQFELKFDVFSNKLLKKLISHSGAPKSYPNLYLEADTFVDTINVSGEYSKQMKIYFNPEFYQLYDDNEKTTNVFETKQTEGSYKLQFINVDNQKSQHINIRIDNRINRNVSDIIHNASLPGRENKRE